MGGNGVNVELRPENIHISAFNTIFPVLSFSGGCIGIIFGFDPDTKPFFYCGRLPIPDNWNPMVSTGRNNFQNVESCRFYYDNDQ